VPETREQAFVATVDEADPSVASAQRRHTSRLFRGDHCYVATSQVSIQASAHRFDVAISLVVEVDGAGFFSRRWLEAIPRELVVTVVRIVVTSSDAPPSSGSYSQGVQVDDLLILSGQGPLEAAGVLRREAWPSRYG
jgi:hypothetical protein